MITEIKMPKLSKTMEDGAVVDFMVKVGDQVWQGDCICEIEADKACVDFQSPADGFVKHILVLPGRSLPVDTTFMVLAGKDEQVPESLIERLKSKIEVLKNSDSGETEQVVGREVIEAAAVEACSETDVKLGDSVPLSRLQKLTAQKMLASKGQIPCFYLNTRVDVTELAQYRNTYNQKSRIKLSYNDFVIKAVGVALENFPVMTGTISGDVITIADSINVGFAASVSDALYVPVIKNANSKLVEQIAKERIALVEKANSNKLSPADLEGACITISSLGSFGVDSFIPIVIPGQCSIIGIGQIVPQAVPGDGNIVFRKIFNMTIAVDHRITNGAYASEFLDFVRKYLEDISNFRQK